jgi:hypothetical protein
MARTFFESIEYDMKSSIDEASSDPTVHSGHIRDELSHLIEHLRKDVERVREPRFQALLETSAEVLLGLRKAFEHYDAHDETAWRLTELKA